MADQLSAEDHAEFQLDIVACAAAEAFTEAYYYAFEKDRATLATYYTAPSSTPEASIPFIAWNGLVHNSATDFQTHVETLSNTHFDMESLDCTILNPRALPASSVKGGSGNDNADFERRMSLMVTVGGSVRLEEKFTGPMREFSETFVLTPDPEKLPALGQKVEFSKGWRKEWVIQTQNFRFTEWGASEIEGADKKADGTKEMEMKTANGAGGKRAFGGPAGGRGFASHFAAAGLNVKGKGKA